MELKGQVVIYSIIGCPHCLRAKNRLSELAIPYKDVCLDSFPQERENVKKLTGGKVTVPQIFFNEVHIGGNVELQKLAKNIKELEKLLKMVKTTPPPENAPTIPDPSTAVDYGKSDGEFVCEPDEYAVLVRDMRMAGLIKDHKSGILKTHKNTFNGQEFIDWIMKEKSLGSEDQFKEDGFYRLLEDDESRALNAGSLSQCAPLPAGELGENLRKLILRIYSKTLTKDGKAVSYKSIAEEPDFEKYVKLTKELQRVKITSCSREEKLAFFINIYNALVIHATIKMGPPTNLWQRYKFFNTVCYIIGGEIYSLQDIENGVLRANRKGVGMFKKPFGKNDSRLQVALEECEPLIHFALNCGAKSCPPIKTFSAKGVKAELKVAAEAFFESDDGVKVNVEKKEIGVSQIFNWYQADFGGTVANTLQFILERMADGEKKEALKKLVQTGEYKFTYLRYDWGNNSKE